MPIIEAKYQDVVACILVKKNKILSKFESLAKIREQNRKDKFQEWLSSKNEDGFIIKNILNKMIKEITSVLTEDGYVIKDQKAFRDYLASYIYNEC